MQNNEMCQFSTRILKKICGGGYNIKDVGLLFCDEE